MNVALLGSGGREHALAWRISQSPLCKKLWALPGNPGISGLATCRGISAGDIKKILAFCKEESIDFVIVGPEDPLADGIVDRLQEEGITCFGPTKAAAKLEGDKAFAKEIMRSANVPTAESRTFTNFSEAERFVERRDAPMVVKAAGLAKGKGVSICKTRDEARKVVRDLMRVQIFGDAGKTIVVEDKLEGVECSVLALVDGGDVFVLPPCQDHKPAFEGNVGPMTGGMGAFCPSRTLSEEDHRKVESDIIIPTLDALAREEIKYRGLLYVGLMLTSDGPKVLEFNVRFGDPETQPLMMRWSGDVLAALYATATGGLADFVDSGGIGFDDRHSVCVVLASGGDPGEYVTGREISDLNGLDNESTRVFQAGTAQRRDATVTDGGRVLGVTALGETLASAREAAYATIEKIEFDGMHFRRDIGSRES